MLHVWHIMGYKYMNKFFIILIILFSFNITSAIEINSGEQHNILTIDKCQGPINIKVTSEEGIKDKELFIKYCTKYNNNLWKCQCDKKFDLIINTQKNTHNMYDFTI